MAQAQAALAGLPQDIGGELKWYVWNRIWHTVNSGLGSAWWGEPAMDKQRAAKEDEQRWTKHFEAAKRTGTLSAAALTHIKEQVVLAGQAALAAVLGHHSMVPERIQSMAPPKEIQASLWNRMVKGIRLAASSISESALAVSPETWHHWHKGQSYEKEYERAWNETYEEPPAPPPPEIERTVPPRPVTLEWLKKYGGLQTAAPREVREETFTDLDEGMVSNCNLLWLRPADGGAEECYVVKRSLGGVAAHWTAGSLIAEFRFYDKVVRKGGWPKAAALLAKAMHVPELLVANLGPEGQELDGFAVIMERLHSPKWARVDPSEGCNREQAIAAVGALGRLHGFFADDGELGAMSFLGVKPVGGEGQFEAGYAFAFLRSSGDLRRHLTPAAHEACSRMMVGGAGRLAKRLMQPPLTLLHGDFKLENLRFSGSTVGAFDWGLVTRGRGAWDFAYFLIHGLRPQMRRQLDRDLVRAYLGQRQKAAGEAKGKAPLIAVTETLCQKFESEVRSAMLCVLGKLIIVLTDYQDRKSVV